MYIVELIVIGRRSGDVRGDRLNGLQYLSALSHRVVVCVKDLHFCTEPSCSLFR
jgi:hypothetical protein